MTFALRYPRLFVDDDGISHWEDCTLELPTRDFAPPATPLEASEQMPAEGFVVLRFAPDWEGPWHPSPYRQWLFLLSGSLTVSVSDGTERTLSGHSSRGRLSSARRLLRGLWALERHSAILSTVCHQPRSLHCARCGRS